MGKIIKISKNPEDTFDIAYDLATKINKPGLIGLSGELGTGKTVFAKGFGHGLGVKELITSPTFLGICEYYSGSLPFIHMDFYKKTLRKENINSYLKKNSVILIEWVENFTSVFKQELNLDTCVYIQYLKNNEESILENERQITIEQRSDKYSCYTK